MVRVSSFGQQQLLIRGIMDNQEKVFEAQRQISTGKKTDDYAGLAGQTSTVLGARSFLGRVETYQQTIDTVRGKLDANDVQIDGMLNSMEDLRENIQVMIANNSAEGFSELLDQTFKFVTNGLNTNFDGTYLFSGAKTGTQPVTAVRSPTCLKMAMWPSRPRSQTVWSWILACWPMTWAKIFSRKCWTFTSLTRVPAARFRAN